MPTTTAKSGLMLHCGGAEVDWSTIERLPDPTPLTDTHFPIRHDTFINTVVGALTTHGYTITDQCHALWGDNGLRYFGIVCLAGNDLPVCEEGKSEWEFVLGLRNAADFSFSATALGGTRMPWLCDNLMWSGGEVLKIARKHTRFILRDLEGLCHERIGGVAKLATDIGARHDAYKAYDFANSLPASDNLYVDDVANEEARDNCRLASGAKFILDAAAARAVAPMRVAKVWNEFQRPDGPGGNELLAGGSAYTMMNAFTEVEKASPSLLEGPRRNSRLTSLLDAQCGLTSTLVSVDE